VDMGKTYFKSVGKVKLIGLSTVIHMIFPVKTLISAGFE
jgi:hypothetical protein